jgi:hypothetical protein
MMAIIKNFLTLVCTFGMFLDRIRYIASSDRMYLNDEPKGLWKEAVLISFKMLSQHLH